MSSRIGPTWPPLSADPSTIMAWCLAHERPTPFYTQRLGLRHKEAFPKNKGKPMFEGEVALECNCLHKRIMEAVQRIADRYHTKEELETAVKLQHDLSIAETTRPLLRDVGPIIWNDSGPHQTKIVPHQYPRHLKFGNKNDLETIMLYVYCWIVGRVTRAQANRRVSRNKRAIRDVSMSSSEDKDQDDIDASENSDGCLASVFDNGQPGTSRYGLRINNPSVPVASMLPMESNKTTSATRPGVTQPGAEESSHTVASRDRSNALLDGDDESGTFQPGRPTSLRGVKRKGYSTINAPLSKRLPKANHASLTPGLITRVKAHELGTEGEAGNASYPSPPLLQPDELDEAPNGRNFPNIYSSGSSDRSKATLANNTSHPNTRTIAQTQHNDPNSCSPAKEDGSTPAIGLQGAASDNEDHDNDSVQGLEASRAETTPECRKITPSIPQRRLVVRLKLTILLDDNEHDRQRLAADLFVVLRGKLQEPPNIVLSSTLDLLDSVLKKDSLLLTEVSIGNLGHVKDCFKQWLNCLRVVVKFYEDTKFTGNLSARRAFRKTLPVSLAMSVRQMFLESRASLSKWRYERKISNNEISNKDFAREVSLVLFHLASWEDDMELQEVEAITLNFTEELLAWFK